MLWLLGIPPALAALWGFAVEPYFGRITHYKIPLANLHQHLIGLRILLLSDFHGKTKLGFQSYQNLVHKVQPDIIAVAGDLGDDEPEIQAVIASLHGLQAPLGVYFVPGNHEYRYSKARALDTMQRLEKIGIHPLLNEAVQLQRHGTYFTFFGVDYGRRLRMPELNPDQLSIMLAHNPIVINRAAAAGVNLVLAGHTHGGQVRIPFVGPILRKTILGRRLETGMHQVLNTWLVVSKGLGESHLSVRFACRPEAVVIELFPWTENEGKKGTRDFL